MTNFQQISVLKLTKTAKIAFWLFPWQRVGILFLIAISLHVDPGFNSAGSLRKSYILNPRANAKKVTLTCTIRKKNWGVYEVKENKDFFSVLSDPRLRVSLHSWYLFRSHLMMLWEHGEYSRLLSRRDDLVYVGLLASLLRYCSSAT